MKIIPTYNILSPIKIGDEKLYYDTPESIPFLCTIVRIKTEIYGTVYEFKEYNNGYTHFGATIYPHKFKNP